eukprot:7637587-Pyramimonas_sp.AAC.1
MYLASEFADKVRDRQGPLGAGSTLVVSATLHVPNSAPDSDPLGGQIWQYQSNGHIGRGRMFVAVGYDVT